MFDGPNELQIEGKKIGLQYPTYFIADIAANHDGDLNRAIDLIFLAKEAGADAAKFQHFKAQTIVSDLGFKSLGAQQSHQANWKKSVFEVYQSASVNTEWTETLKQTCINAGITFFTSPYDFDLVDHIDPFVPAYKIGSGDITWIDMIRFIASKGKPYILATGASTMDDVCRAVKAGLDINNQLALLQCNTNYTASIENLKFVQLNVLKTYRAMFPNMVLGISDHTPGNVTVLGAVALGARIVEKHFTDNTNREGPDHKFSLDSKAWMEMVERTRELEAALGCGVKKIEGNELETVVLQRRSIRTNKNMKKGQTITEKDLEYLRPCPLGAMAPFMKKFLIGKVVNKNISKGESLTSNDIES